MDAIRVVLDQLGQATDEQLDEVLVGEARTEMLEGFAARAAVDVDASGETMANVRGSEITVHDWRRADIDQYTANLVLDASYRIDWRDRAFDEVGPIRPHLQLQRTPNGRRLASCRRRLKTDPPPAGTLRDSLTR